MSWRHAATELRAKYARVFDLPLWSVVITELDHRAAIWCPGDGALPIWTTEGAPPSRDALVILGWNIGGPE